jgi:Spy/CpxP family protein refolding chaperone
MSVDDQVAQLAKELNLDENQKTQVKAILQNQSDEMQKLRQDSSVSQEDRRTKFQALRSTSTTKIKALLTADQATKYDDYLSKQRGHRQQGAPGGAQPGNPPVQ